jgi:hypothetical protein
MKNSIRGVILAVVLFLELVFFVLSNEWLRGPVFDLSYRHDQRVAAFFDNVRNPTPATRSTLDAELVRMNRYLDLRMIVTLSVFVGIDGLVIYRLWYKGKQKTAASLG